MLYRSDLGDYYETLVSKYVPKQSSLEEGCELVMERDVEGKYLILLQKERESKPLAFFTSFPDKENNFTVWLYWVTKKNPSRRDALFFNKKDMETKKVINFLKMFIASEM